MTEYDNATKVKRRELILKIEDRERLSDMAAVMATVEGRRVMNELLRRCGVGRLSFSGPGQAEQTAFYEGQRNIGNYYWAMLTKNFKKEWLIMTDEAEKRTEATNGGNNGSTTGENRRSSRLNDSDDQGAGPTDS